MELFSLIGLLGEFCDGRKVIINIMMSWLEILGCDSDLFYCWLNVVGMLI